MTHNHYLKSAIPAQALDTAVCDRDRVLHAGHPIGAKRTESRTGQNMLQMPGTSTDVKQTQNGTGQKYFSAAENCHNPPHEAAKSYTDWAGSRFGRVKGWTGQWLDRLVKG